MKKYLRVFYIFVPVFLVRNISFPEGTVQLSWVEFVGLPFLLIDNCMSLNLPMSKLSLTCEKYYSDLLMKKQVISLCYSSSFLLGSLQTLSKSSISSMAASSLKLQYNLFFGFLILRAICFLFSAFGVALLCCSLFHLSFRQGWLEEINVYCIFPVDFDSCAVSVAISCSFSCGCG